MPPRSRSRPWVRHWPALAVALAACQGAGAVGALATGPELERWYAQIRRPAFLPPDAVFAPVWTLLYALMALAVWRVWRLDDGAGRRQALAWFILQLALNVAWSWIFFHYHRPDLALAEILLLLAALALTTFAFARVDRPAAWLMVPCLAWVAFATLLNLRIWQLNA